MYVRRQLFKFAFNLNIKEMNVIVIEERETHNHSTEMFFQAVFKLNYPTKLYDFLSPHSSHIKCIHKIYSEPKLSF